MTIATIEQQRGFIHHTLRKTRKRKSKPVSEQIVHELQRDGLLPFKVRLTQFQALGLASFLRDVNSLWGASGALSPVDLEREYSPGQGVTSQPWYPTEIGRRADKTLRQLHSHERELLKWLLTARERKNVTLALLGQELGETEEENRAQAVATGIMRSFANTLAEYHNLRPA